MCSRLPDDEHSDSKIVEDIKIKNQSVKLETKHFVGLYYIIILQGSVRKN